MLQSNLLPSRNQSLVGVLLGMDEVLSKVCTGCGKNLPLDAFKKHKTGKFGRYSWCRECCSKKGKEHRRANPLTEEGRKVVRERSKAFRDLHPITEEERVAERQRHRAYYAKNHQLTADKLLRDEQNKLDYAYWLKTNPDSKICTGCGIEKDITSFGLRTNKDGLKVPKSRCRECDSKQTQDYLLRKKHGLGPKPKLITSIPETKICLGPCGKDLPLDAFGKFKEGKYGRRAKCKKCLAQIEKERRVTRPSTEEQKEAARRRTKAWAGANPERVKANAKKNYQAHPERAKAAAKAWQNRNPEKRLIAFKVWVRNNPEKAKAASKRWRENNPEKVRDLYKNWVASNRERVRELNRKWYTEHPEHRRFRYEATHNSDFTFDQWLEILVEFGHKCVYCGHSDVKLTMDHVIPISKGGLHTKDNIVPACRSCNSKKGAKDPSLFKFVVQRVKSG
jgi:5-methylcytosine-specific restriction endonuclease McrA